MYPGRRKRKTVTVRGVILSGRWDRKVRLLVWITLYYMTRVSFIVHTEMDNDARGHAVKRLRPKAWATWRGENGPRGEVAIQTKRLTWKHKRGRSYVNGPDRGPGVEAIIRQDAIQHRRHKWLVLVLGALHARAGVEKELRSGRWRESGMSLHARETQKASDNLEDLAAQVKGLAMLLGDWNLHLGAKYVRDHLERNLGPGWHLPKHPGGGTHGPRWIDFAVWNDNYVPGYRVEVRLKRGRYSRASDHVPVVVVIRFVPI